MKKNSGFKLYLQLVSSNLIKTGLLRMKVESELAKKNKFAPFGAIFSFEFEA